MTTTPIRPIALFGGTFDPIHLGHLRAAWEAAECLDAEVRMVPAHVPPHRPQPLADPAQRLTLLRLALASQQRLTIDERELRRGGASYSIDTLRELRGEVGSARSLILLVGADAYTRLTTWHRWRELFDHAHIGVLTRPGHSADLPDELRVEMDKRLCDDVDILRRTPGGRILRIAVTPLQISATAVRELLAEGYEPRFLLSDSVLERIRAEGWYRRRA
ncbi:MAG: nicotinate-nucleotide adenylyltransferase [Tahibacter sp.]